jgi:hypothetical protein
MTIMFGTYLRGRERASNRSGGAIAVVWWLALVACSSEPIGTRASPPPSTTAAVSASASTRKVYGAAWERAATSGDEADLARLALAEGATGLLEALDDPAHRAVALAALAHAPDRDLAIGPLALRLARGEADAPAVADALMGVLAVPGLDRERLDPTGEHDAARALLSFARDASHPAELRSKVVSALGRLAERGVVRQEDIPSPPSE